jgi:hypothetical protein
VGFMPGKKGEIFQAELTAGTKTQEYASSSE